MHSLLVRIFPKFMWIKNIEGKHTFKWENQVPTESINMDILVITKLNKLSVRGSYI